MIKNGICTNRLTIMGCTATAILCYGFDIGEKLPSFAQGDDFDFDEWILKEAGYSAWEPGVPDSYWEGRRAILDGYPITLRQHGHYDYPGYIITTPRTVSSASSRRSQVISTLIDSFDDREIIRLWCIKHDVGFKEPEWLLCSYYG